MQEPNEVIRQMFEKLSKPLWFELAEGQCCAPGTEGAVNLLWALQGQPSSGLISDPKLWQIALTISELSLEGATVNRTATTLNYLEFLEFWGNRSIKVGDLGTVNLKALKHGLKVNA